MPKKWWYDAIKSTLADLKEGVGYSETMADYAEIMLDQLMEMLILEQPYGHIEYDPMGHYAKTPPYTVSARLGHTPIENGWRPYAEELDVANQVGIRAGLDNVSEHIKWVLEGAPEHGQPTIGGPMFFWWGEPQRWPAPAYHDETGREMGPGYYQFKRINHPGQDPNPFVQRARDWSRPEMTDTIKTGVGKYITNVMASSGLRQVQ